MALLLVTGPALLPEYRGTTAGRLDLASVALSLAAIMPVVYGLKETARNGLGAAPTAAVVLGLAAGVIFVRRQRGLTSPLLELRLFADRHFSSALVTMLATGVVMAGVSLMTTLYLQAVRGLSPLSAGLWLVPQNVAMAAGSMLAPVLARRIRPGRLMAAGLLIAAAGLLLQIRAGTDGVLVVVASLTVASLGISPAMALTMNLMLGSTPPHKAGSAASLFETGGELGIALGVATLGTLGTVIYRGHLAVPAGTPGQAADAARQSVSGAVATAQHLPDPIAADLLTAAHSAFTAGLSTVAIVGTAVFAGLALLTSLAFRHVAATGTAAQPPSADERAPSRTPLAAAA
jgi:MFS transporter, DHA2 family, multidrug resistance protein